MYETLFVIGPPRTLYDMVPFLVVGALLVAYGVWHRKRRPNWRWVTVVAIGVLLALGGFAETVASQKRHEALYRAYTEGRCQVAEGVVHLDHEQPIEGHDIGEFGSVGEESFVIGNAPAYATTVANGGVLREGKWVRVWVHLGSVVRIDRLVDGRPAVPADSTSRVPSALEIP